MRFLALLALAPWSAFAGGTLGLAVGDCRDPELATASTAFQRALVARLGDGAFPPEEVLERLRPLPTASAEELGRQLDASQARFYAGDLQGAADGAQSALQGLARLGPRSDAWALEVRAWLLQGLALRSLGKKAEAAEAFKRPLRVDPRFAPDPDYYSPSTIQLLEGIRKDVAKAKKVRFQVTSAPPGATVLLDGFPAGKTPFEADLMPGSYRLQLTLGELTSFVHQVAVAQGERQSVDLAFEGALSERVPLCVQGQGTDVALKLAAISGAESLVVFRTDARRAEPGMVTATLIEVNRGAPLRSGSVRTKGGQEAQGLADLAEFVLTGRAAPAVTPGPVAATVAAAPGEALRPPTLRDEAPVAAVEEPMGRGRGPRVASYVLLGSAAVALGAGLGVYLGGAGDRAALGALLDGQGKLKDPATAAQAAALTPPVDANGSLAIGLWAASAALLATGVGLFLALPPDSPVDLALGPAGAVMHGRF
ncbi:MAG: PEGA domain-containing protein [Myxococcaceae bacterium]|nr:PEGA domain-containing protein [Myxococcaceae bacterium]